MKRRRYFLLDILQDNDGNLYMFYYDMEKCVCLNFKFWEWLENLPDIQKIGYEDTGEFCQDCPYYEEDDYE